jgi:ferric-dicitrate binding protein FerR (iron transport regulator)
MTEKELHQLIEKYSKGEASEEEILLLEQILSSSEMDVKANFWNSSEERLETKNRMYKNIKSQLKTHRLSYVLKIAASFLVLLGIASFVFFQNTNSFTTVVYNDTGVPKYIYLADSTRVILNTNSELTYTDEFNKSSREVSLKGEANFDVTSNKNKPFIVHTKSLSTRVLGTEFNIKESNENVFVTVSEGLVEVSNELDKLQLEPDQQVVFNSRSKQLEKKTVTSGHFNLWYEEEINLVNLSLYEVSKILENLYDTSIEFKREKDKDIKMSISFRRDEDLNQIIKRINFVNKAKFKKKASEIIVE